MKTAKQLANAFHRSHVKTQTTDCRLQTMQTVQTMQTGILFSLSKL